MVRTLTKWTVQEYHRMIETGLLAGRQVELLDGNIIDTAPELPIHRQPVQGQYQSIWKLQSGAMSTTGYAYASLAFPDIDLEVEKFLH